MAKSLLFVCGNNKGRSVVSEYLFRNMLKERDEKLVSRVMVSSSGIDVEQDAEWFKGFGLSRPEPIFGRQPYRNLTALLKRRGIDTSGHRSRELTKAMVEEADLIIISDEYPPFRKEAILSLWPSVAGKSFTFSEFVEAKVEDKVKGQYLLSEDPNAQPYADEDSIDFSPQYWDAIVAEIKGYLAQKMDKFLSYLQLS